MAVQAAINKFKDEFILTFAQRQSLLSRAATPETMSKGHVVTWLVSGHGSQTAVTRAQNGMIPYGTPSNTQVSATLIEQHAPQSLTGFDIFASQGDQARLMGINCMAIIKQAQDSVILTELANATQDYPTTGQFQLETVTGSRAILGNQHVPVSEEDQMFTVISPGAEAYLLQTTEFTNADYVDVKPLTGGISTKYRRWMGTNWIVCDVLTGLGGASEIMYMYHRSALGYAYNAGEIMVDAGWDAKQRESWAIATVYHQAKIIQNAGIIKITHDGSAFNAS